MGELMKKTVLAVVVAVCAAGITTLAGCADKTEGQSGADNSSSVGNTEQSSSAQSSDSSSAALESEAESSGAEQSSEGSSSDSVPVVPEQNEEGFYLSACPVPAWGITESDDGNVFMTASEYDTYRALQTTEFENGAVKDIRVDVYVISEDFDMAAFSSEWGVDLVWNGSFYEGTAAIPEKYADMSVEEIKLDIAKPLLKKYGSATYDGFPEIVMVDPSIAPDPAFDF